MFQRRSWKAYLGRKVRRRLPWIKCEWNVSEKGSLGETGRTDGSSQSGRKEGREEVRGIWGGASEMVLLDMTAPSDPQISIKAMKLFWE